MEIGRRQASGEYADDPSAPSPNWSTSPLFSWQRMALHCQRNDSATAVTWNCLIAEVQLVILSLSIDGLIGLQQVPMNRPTSVSEFDQHCFWGKSIGLAVNVPC
ncbi:hypothetical protein KIN20_009965 [Parelaphostrongylus tenuis]|uniref:Uncharacterized protein n=1 Tax=Parelaphostrongylus tenuis TaxID=148309 RepID=A0AAD5MSM1_PARTN|nr:hypothetical protein KIN20_009965 [Parelaphostrongylus tenuis]